MIKLIKRTEIFETQNNLSHEIADLQRAFFDTEYAPSMFDALNIEGAKHLCRYATIVLPHPQIETFSAALSSKLLLLLGSLNCQSLIIISHLKLNFFGNLKNTYPPLRNAYTRLREIAKTTNYAEAFCFDMAEIATFVDIFFWLMRCDASIAEYVFWGDGNDRFSFYLCKYGNLHFADYTDEPLITRELINNFGFQLSIAPEFDQFSQASAITGRSIVV